MVVGVANDEGEVYRRIVVHGPKQHGAFLECLMSHGFFTARSRARGPSFDEGRLGRSEAPTRGVIRARPLSMLQCGDLD